MRNRALRVIVCALILLAVPLSLLAAAFCLPAQYDKTYLAALSDKWERLQVSDKPRIVAVGGSGVCFDLRSDLLEQELPGYQAVNFGLYAGLGTTVMLDLALGQLRAGDILIFAPELSAQTYSTYFNAEAMWQAADGNPALLSALPRDYLGAMLGAFPAFAASKARLYREGMAPAGDEIYARASFNAYGDMACPRREQNRMPGGFDENMRLRFDPALPTAAFLEKLDHAAAVCEKKGVRFYFRYCPMNAAAITAQEAARMTAFDTSVREALPCPILGRLEDAVMEPGWFFDTNFHLNSAGQAAATRMLAQDLKAALGDTAPVTLPLPEMPPMAGSVLLSGNTDDESCFLYEREGDAFLIAALSDEGKTREELTVPVSFGGLPIRGFDASVFAGNTVLRSVVLQENIQLIPDGAFDGCTALERITLTQTAPSACTVGQGLLEGTSALVYVPGESYSAYCTNYFWSIYAGRLRADTAAPRAEDGPPDEPAPNGNEILYIGNGGQLRRQAGDMVTRTMDQAHLRVNTLQGASYFAREGYVLVAWNTAPDGGGERVGLGSRSARREGLRLYAQWEKASPVEDFLWETRENEVWLRAYTGDSARCVIPEDVGGLPVRRICGGAFSDRTLRELVFPASLRAVEPGAFSDCELHTVTLYDSLTDIGEDSFVRCEGLRTLYVNAALSPVYSGSYYDTFSDKMDWLLSIRDQKKLVLASGSSGRYGYDSEMLRRAFPDYEVANMGVYAWSNMLPQLELIRALMREGDILLSAPEFDAIAYQFCTTNRLDEHFWAMLESDYDLLSLLDLREFSAVWESFALYQQIRGGMAGKSYSLSPASFDDDGRYYAFSTYNRYGDFILPRPRGERDELLRHNIADYTCDSFSPDTVESLNREYRRFLNDGVEVFFSYTPRNRSSLTAQSTPETRAALHRFLCDALCVPVISDIEDYLLSGIYFWQIDSHTGTEGAEIRTRQVIDDLRRQRETGA